MQDYEVVIIDFTIKNFRSIKTEQLLSLHAANKHKLHNNNIAFFDNGIGILRSCAIYGANAAGKSNIIKAIDALVYLVERSGSLKDGEAIECYDPYLLSVETHKAPIRFEIEFIVAQQRFSYQIEYNQFEILFEKLDYYPSSRAANLFTRTSATDFKNVKFGEHYKGGKKQIGFFANNSYLSKAGNSPESPEIARTVFDFFRKKIDTLQTHERVEIAD